MLVLGLGLAGTGTVVGGVALSSVMTLPLVIVADPVVPLAVAPQDAATLSAVSLSPPVMLGWVVDLLTFLMLVVLVTDPVAPSDPDDWSVSASEVKSVAGPYTTLADGAEADCGLLDAFAVSEMVGVGA